MQGFKCFRPLITNMCLCKRFCHVNHPCNCTRTHTRIHTCASYTHVPQFCNCTVVIHSPKVQGDFNQRQVKLQGFRHWRVFAFAFLMPSTAFKFTFKVINIFHCLRVGALVHARLHMYLCVCLHVHIRSNFISCTSDDTSNHRNQLFWHQNHSCLFVHSMCVLMWHCQSGNMTNLQN